MKPTSNIINSVVSNDFKIVEKFSRTSYLKPFTSNETGKTIVYFFNTLSYPFTRFFRLINSDVLMYLVKRDRVIFPIIWIEPLLFIDIYICFWISIFKITTNYSKVQLTWTFGKLLCTFSFGCFQIYPDKRAQQLIF